MYGWSFAARTADEVGALLAAMGKHRYLADIDHRLHVLVDRALGLSPAPAGAPWRSASTAEVVAVLERLWAPGEDGAAARAALRQALRDAAIPTAAHAPFASDPEAAPEHELIELNWVLLPVSALAPERHAGALRAIAQGERPAEPDAPVYVEGPLLAEPELCDGAPRGVLRGEWLLWADGPYAYCEYLFRGVSRAAGLLDPPCGYEDVDRDG